MPKILCELEEVTESVMRPVVLDITREIFKNTNIADDIQILFPGEIGRAQQKGASIDEQFENTSNPDQVKLPYTSQMSIEVEEEYEVDRMLNNVIYRAEDLYLFVDRQLETVIRPVYGHTKVTLNFKYRAKDQNEAIRWRDDIRNKTSMNREVFLHDTKYHFLIPETQLVVLKEIHRMREAVAGYGQTFNEYFAEHRSSRITMVTTLAGTQGRWAVAESQMRIQGWFDFEGVPERGAKDQDTTTPWTIGFAYHFYFDKPIACTMVYPLMIHNQLMDQKFRPSPDAQPLIGLEQNQRSYSSTGRYYAYFEAGAEVEHYYERVGYAIPSFDEFLPEQVIPGTKRIFTVLCSLGENDPRFLFNLRDLGPDFAIDPAMFCCLEKEWPYMTKPYRSVFSLSLYRGRHLLPDDKIRVDKDLNVYATTDLDYRHYYHVRFAIYTNLRDLHPKAIERVQGCPECLQKILLTIEPTLYPAILPCVVEDKWVPRACLDNVLDQLVKGDDVKSMKTVLTNEIVTYRPQALIKE